MERLDVLGEQFERVGGWQFPEPLVAGKYGLHAGEYLMGGAGGGLQAGGGHFRIRRILDDSTEFRLGVLIADPPGGAALGNLDERRLHRVLRRGAALRFGGGHQLDLVARGQAGFGSILVCDDGFIAGNQPTAEGR